MPLDVFDFIVEKGGNPQKIKDSQKRRYAREEVVDEVIALYEDHRTSKLEHSNNLRQILYLTLSAAQYSATQLNSKINEVQKQIGVRRKAKENADDLMKRKADLEKDQKALLDSAAEKELALKKKIGTIGNIVHESVPVENNEVCSPWETCKGIV
jgi:seryl-tRNA synthetase